MSQRPATTATIMALDGPRRITYALNKKTTNIRVMFKDVPERNPKLPPQAIGLPFHASTDTVLALLTWVDAQNVKVLPIAPLSIAAVQEANPKITIPNDFKTLVTFQSVANTLGLRKQFRGNALRNAIFDYIKSYPLKGAEFKLVNTELHGDITLIDKVLWETMYNYGKGLYDKMDGGIQEFGKICEVCKQWQGLYDQYNYNAKKIDKILADRMQANKRRAWKAKRDAEKKNSE